MAEQEPNGPIQPTFRFRNPTLDDIAHLAALVPGGCRLEAAVGKSLAALWSCLLASEARAFSVIEDMGRPFPGRLEAFGLSAFVTRDFAEEFLAAPRPYAPSQFYSHMLSGKNPLLSPDAIARANAADGLDVLVLHFGTRDNDLSNPRTAQAVMTGSAAFYFTHSGYRLNTMFGEVYGAASAQFMERGGFRRVRDYQAEDPAAFEGAAPEHYPYLFVLRREWVERAAVSPLSQLFHPAPPRLLFSKAERRLLEQALLNEADAQVARSLGVSLDGVKKRWRSIFERVERNAPSLFPSAETQARGDSRGQEKRRYVLEYVRSHLEELRPHEVRS